MSATRQPTQAGRGKGKQGTKKVAKTQGGKQAGKKPAAQTRPKPRRDIRDNIHGINKPQLARLVRRSAVPEVSYINGKLYEQLRAELSDLLTPAVLGSVSIAQYLRVKTVTSKHVQLYLALRGVYDANAFEKGKKTGETFRFSKKRPNAKTKEIKTSLGKSIFARQPFQRLCREIAQKSDSDVRFSATALEALQFYTEAELGERIRAGSLITRAEQRVTLSPKDVQVAVNISHAARRPPVNAGPSNVRLTTYIYKVLKQVSPDTGSSGLAIQAVQNLINGVFSQIMAAASALLRARKAATLDSRTVQAAVRIVLPGELRKHAVSEGTKAVSKFNAGEAGNQGGSVAIRAGLTFPVARFINAARTFSSGNRISRTSGVYVAAVLEYLSAELLEYAGNFSRDHKKVRISTGHIHQAVNSHKELSILFHGVLLGTAFLGDAHATALPASSKKEEAV